MPDSTSSHPPSNKQDATEVGQSTSHATASSELPSLKVRLHKSLRQFPDFPSPGILFEDILPLFSDPVLHEALIRALELHIKSSYAKGQRPDVIVGLEARGLLFGPSLALRLGAGFVPVRKQGKLPGPTETASYEKEYGKDFFQIQADAIKQGQQVLVVDDIIATGGSAAAAGSLVKKLGGILLGYVFILELDFLKGREKLDASVYTLLSSQEEDSKPLATMPSHCWVEVWKRPVRMARRLYRIAVALGREDVHERLLPLGQSAATQENQSPTDSDLILGN